MTAKSIVDELEALGKDSYRKVILKHGAAEPLFGVSVEELKKIQKRVRTDYQLALDLWATGVYDARYLAGLVADDKRMTKADLQCWAEQACAPLSTSTVPWVAAGSAHAWELATEWIASATERVAVAGWATLASLVSVADDAKLDLPALKKLLQHVQQSIHAAPNDVRSAMNGFVIAVGSFVAPLSAFATQVGTAIGPVPVDKGDTACKVPFAPDAIAKVAQRGSIGKKRKTAKC